MTGTFSLTCQEENYNSNNCCIRNVASLNRFRHPATDRPIPRDLRSIFAHPPPTLQGGGRKCYNVMTTLGPLPQLGSPDMAVATAGKIRAGLNTSIDAPYVLAVSDRSSMSSSGSTWNRPREGDKRRKHCPSPSRRSTPWSHSNSLATHNNSSNDSPPLFQ